MDTEAITLTYLNEGHRAKGVRFRWGCIGNVTLDDVYCGPRNTARRVHPHPRGSPTIEITSLQTRPYSSPNAASLPVRDPLHEPARI